MTGLYPPPGSANQHVAGLVEASHAQPRRMRGAENRAELKAMRPPRFAVVRRLLNRLSRGSR
jgi:hypothetical protein